MLRRVKIGSRLIGVFSLIIVFMLVISVLGAISIGQINGNGKALYDESVVGISAINELQYDFMILRMKAYVVLYNKAGDSPAVQADTLQKIMDTQFAEIDKSMAEYQNAIVHEEDQKKFDGINDLLSQYKPSYESLINGIREQDPAQLDKAIASCVEVAGNLAASIEDLVAYNQQIGQERLADNDA